MSAAIVKEPRPKATHVGAPAIFALEQACRDICEAFGGYGCYLVGSALNRSDWRDIDVRFIMSDEEFAALFPQAGRHWEHDARWLLLTIAISERLSKVTGLPIDFQFQPQTHANEQHRGARHALGMRLPQSSYDALRINARLIDAAPDLYEALAEIVAWATDDAATAWPKQHAALVRARGEDVR